MLNAVALCLDDESGNWQRREILLKPDVPVHRQEDI